MHLEAASTGLFTASEVEARVGVPATTLRQWERRYGLPRPQRNASGYRLYSADDVSVIEFICRRLDEGVSASRAAELARAQFTAAPSRAFGIAPEAAPSEVSGVAALVKLLLTADLAGAEVLLAQVHAAQGTESLLIHFIQPALKSIGEKWQRGEITLSHEHQASAFLRSKVAQLLDAAGHSRFGPKVVAACGPNEYHEIGLLMLCVVLRRKGVQVQYLGANTPLGDLGIYARSVGAQAILLSVNSDLALETALLQRRDLDDVDSDGAENRPAHDIPVFVGGSVLSAEPARAAGLGRWVGADAVLAAQMIVGLLEQRLAGRQSA